MIKWNFYLAIQVWLVYVPKPVLKFSKCVIRFCISNLKNRFILYYSYISLFNPYFVLVFPVFIARDMYHGAQSSVQGACCLEIGFRHMFSTLACAAFGWCLYRVAGEGSSACAVCQGWDHLYVGVLPNHLGHDSGCQCCETESNLQFAIVFIHNYRAFC